MIVCKFGGSSMADANQFRKVADIVRQDPERRYIVVSAPGKRFDGDTKVTDLLLDCWRLAHLGKDFEPSLQKVRERYAEIVSGLGLTFDLEREIAAIRAMLTTMPHLDYTASRGEYLNAKLMALYLGVPFVDPALYVRFNEDGSYNAEQTRVDLGNALAGMPRAVIAGFYGSTPSGAIHTFPRGGSDTTGAVVAEAAGAALYENWTDVSGLLAADPRIVENVRTVDYISYRELRILSYMGASVLHADAVSPVQRRGIPINIRNTNAPDDPGTIIVYALDERQKSHAVTGVTGRKGMCVVQVEKNMVSDGTGYSAILLDIFKKYHVPFEQCITGIDTITVVVRSDLLEKAQKQIMDDIRKELAPDTLLVKKGMSMIAVVGEDTAAGVNVTVRILSAVAEAGVQIGTINQGAGALNLLIGVADEDFEKTINAIYGVIEKV